MRIFDKCRNATLINLVCLAFKNKENMQLLEKYLKLVVRLHKLSEVFKI